MAELADALDLGSSGVIRVGSSPITRTIFYMPYVKAPWPREFVKQLNENQHNRKYPPYVCSECEAEMVAEKEGWKCPKCNHLQDWMMT